VGGSPVWYGQRKRRLVEALAFVRGDALHFLERTLAWAASDGSITEAEASYVRQLRTALAIPDALAQPVLDRLTYLERLTAIRRGVLPHVQTDVQMESDEVCHLETQTTYHYAVADPLLTEAVLMTLVRMGKRQLLVPQEEIISRHIP
jgi:hypothetical protein